MRLDIQEMTVLAITVAAVVAMWRAVKWVIDRNERVYGKGIAVAKRERTEIRVVVDGIERTFSRPIDVVVQGMFPLLTDRDLHRLLMGEIHREQLRRQGVPDPPKSVGSNAVSGRPGL